MIELNHKDKFDFFYLPTDLQVKKIKIVFYYYNNYFDIYFLFLMNLFYFILKYIY